VILYTIAGAGGLGGVSLVALPFGLAVLMYLGYGYDRQEPVFFKEQG